MANAFLEVRNLVKMFGRVTAVNDISFDLQQGEVLTLLGPSGCGKTTTLSMVAGFEKPTSGDIAIQGNLVVSMGRGVYVPPEKRGLGMVFQNYAIWPHMTVSENVGYPLSVRGVSKEQIKRRVEHTLEVVGLAGFGSRASMSLSGGQQQRVALARALVYEPSVLLLDEPLSNLDAKLRVQMRIELKRLQEQLGITVLFVTHDQIEAMALSTRIAVMNQGRIEQLGSPSDIYLRPETPFVEDFLGHVLRFRGHVVDQTPTMALVALDGSPDTHVRLDAVEEGMSTGDQVLLGIRPEDVQILRPGLAPSNLNTLACQVEKGIYLGGEGELVLRFGEDAYTLNVQRSILREVGTAGETVLLYLPEDRVRIWPDPSRDGAAALKTGPAQAATAGAASAASHHT